MKKVILLSLVLTSGLAVAVPAKHAAKNSFHHWTVTTKEFSTNEKLPSALSKVNWGTQVGVQYSYNDHFYASVDAQLGDHNNWGWGALVGAQMSRGFVRPYVEISYSGHQRVDQKNSELVGYDVGANVMLSRHFVPFFEIDNFLQKDKTGAQLGLNYLVNSNISVGGAFQWCAQTNDNGFNAKVSYSF